jgi:hypothetical protein
MIIFKRVVGVFTPVDTIVLVLSTLNILWISGHLLLALVGYGHFFCNSFWLVSEAANALYVKNPPPPDVFTSPIRACGYARGIVHQFSDYFASWIV